MPADSPVTCVPLSSVPPDLDRAHRAQLVGPLDDMWSAFAAMARVFELRLAGEQAGFACVDDEGRVLRFYVLPQHGHRSAPLLREAMRAGEASRIVVPTLDPGFLSAALDVSATVTPHTLLYAPAVDAAVEGLAGLELAPEGAASAAVDFEERTLGAPRDFLESYVGERVARGELWLHRVDGEIAAVGELRRDPGQEGIAHLGVIVGTEFRGNGVASAILAGLVERCLSEGLAPHCSTEVANVGAQRAIERAGLRASHRLLEVAV